MKNLKKSCKIFLISFFILTFGFYTISFATENTFENSNKQTANNAGLTNTTEAIISENESSEVETANSSTKLGDLFLCDSDVTINYPVSGNVYIMADNVTINNTIDGNVFVLAKTLTLTENAYVYTELYVCAEDINVNGYVYDIYAAGNSLTLSPSSYVIRDLTSACKTCTLSGIIRRHAKIGCNSLFLNPTSAKVYGDFNYSSNREITIPDGVVSGKISFTKEVEKKSNINASAEYIKNLITTLIYATVVVLVVVLAMNSFTEKSATLVKAKFLPVIGYGAVALFITPIVCILLLCTIIGIWAAIALAFIYAFAISIASIITSISLGKLICQKIKKDTKPMVILFSMLIVVALWILYNIPYVGFFTSLTALLIGLGIILFSIFQSNSNKKVKTNELNNITDNKKADESVVNN